MSCILTHGGSAFLFQKSTATKVIPQVLNKLKAMFAVIENIKVGLLLAVWSSFRRKWASLEFGILLMRCLGTRHLDLMVSAYEPTLIETAHR